MSQAKSLGLLDDFGLIRENAAGFMQIAGSRSKAAGEMIGQGIDQSVMQLLVLDRSNPVSFACPCLDFGSCVLHVSFAVLRDFGVELVTLLDKTNVRSSMRSKLAAAEPFVSQRDVIQCKADFAVQESDLATLHPT
jgi:hypothetical protein